MSITKGLSNFTFGTAAARYQTHVVFLEAVAAAIVTGVITECLKERLCYSNDVTGFEIAICDDVATEI